MADKRWVSYLSLAALTTGLGLLLVVQLRTQHDLQHAARSEDWEYAVADLVDNNARLREEIEALEEELADLQDVDRGGTVLQSLVDEVNLLRIANGRVEVSGPGVEVEISGPISVLDLHDLINELRNAGAEALALNDHRLIAWSAINTDGERVTVDGQSLAPPYRLAAIGDAQTLEVALARPGGLIDLLHQARGGVSITVGQRDKLTLPVYGQPFEFAYAAPAE